MPKKRPADERYSPEEDDWGEEDDWAEDDWGEEDDWIKLPKKRSAGKRCSGSAAKLACRKRHQLYLVLADWEKGYSIRKIDLSGSDSKDSDDCYKEVSRTEQRLPPAVFRLEVPHASSGLFAAFGTKIIAMDQTSTRKLLMIDVRTRALTFGPWHKSEPNTAWNACVQIHGKLFKLDDCCFEVLYPPQPEPHECLPNITVTLKWKKLPEPPKLRYYLQSYAVHPDERTMFFSAEKNTDPQKGTKVVTFSFDTERCRWTCHGQWGLPFKDRGYFDPELDAWVGLSGDSKTLGHFCACQVVSADANSSHGQSTPPWKLSKDKLFCVNPAEKHIGATLVFVEGKRRFCLVECFSMEDQGRGDDIWEELQPERQRYLLRVTTFFPKYDTNGDLRIAIDRRVRTYRLPETANHLEKPAAFWM